MTCTHKDHVRDWDYQRMNWIRQEKKKGVSIKELVIRFGAQNVNKSLKVNYI